MWYTQLAKLKFERWIEGNTRKIESRRNFWRRMKLWMLWKGREREGFKGEKEVKECNYPNELLIVRARWH